MIVDLTTLDKCGKFKNFQHLIHVFNGKRGLHLVVLYLVVGYCRVPWGFRVWRGKDTPSPAQLALRLIDTLPKKLTKAFRVIVLADTAFGSVDFLKGSTITWWGKRRWAIEGFFKTSKHRFGLHRFGQGTLLGVYHWLVLSLIAFILAHWAYLSTNPSQLPDWGIYAHLALQTLLPEVVISLLLLDVERTRPLLNAFGLDLQLTAILT